MKSRRKIFFGLFLAGFLAGILYANTGARNSVLSSDMFSRYFLEEYADAEFSQKEYLLYILYTRISLLGLLILFGQIPSARRLAAGGMLLWTGFSSGLFMTASIIKMRASGLLFCAAALLPQLPFYIAGFWILLWYFFCWPQSRWNSSKSIVIFLTIGTGVVLESYINPIFLKIFLKTI